jgi:hypothetical protein
MTLTRRIAILSLFLTAVASGTWAAPPGPIAVTAGQSVSLEGLKLTIVSCAHAGTGSCTNLELVPVTVGRGIVSFLLVDDNGSLGGTQSAALSQTTSNTTTNSLTVVLTIADTNSARVVNTLDVQTTGTYNLRTSCVGTNNCHTSTPGVSSGMASLSAGATGSLTNALSQSTSQQMPTATGLSVASNSFTLTETLSQNSENFNINTFNIFSQLITLHATPEPASFSIMLLGLGALAAVRRRRKA